MKILFICEGNIFRSQMAEAFLKHYLPEADVTSAGTHVAPSWEGKRAVLRFSEAADAMQKIGIEMNGALMNKLTPEMLEEADRVILVGDIVAGIPEYLANEPKLEEWHVPDPGYGKIPVDDARDIIQDKVEALVQELKA